MASGKQSTAEAGRRLRRPAFCRLECPLLSALRVAAVLRPSLATDDGAHGHSRRAKVPQAPKVPQIGRSQTSFQRDS